MIEAHLTTNASAPVEPPLKLATMQWRTSGNNAVDLFHNDAVAYNGSIYYVGGMRAGQSTGTFLRSNGPAITQTYNDMAVGRAQHTTIVVGSKMHVFGGNNANASGLINTHTVYDFNAQTWSTESQAMPFLTGMGDGVAIGTDIYLLGGYIGTNSETPTSFPGWKYDTVGKVWTELTGLSGLAGQVDVGCAAIGRDIYITGGRRTGTYNANFWKYNVDSGTVTPLANRPQAYGCRRCVQADKNRIVTLMGLVSDQGVGHGYMYWYDVATDTWNTGPQTAYSRGVTAAARLGRSYFIAGGYGGAVIINGVELYEPA